MTIKSFISLLIIYLVLFCGVVSSINAASSNTNGTNSTNNTTIDFTKLPGLKELTEILSHLIKSDNDGKKDNNTHYNESLNVAQFNNSTLSKLMFSAKVVSWNKCVRDYSEYINKPMISYCDQVNSYMNYIDSDRRDSYVDRANRLGYCRYDNKYNNKFLFKCDDMAYSRFKSDGSKFGADTGLIYLNNSELETMIGNYQDALRTMNSGYPSDGYYKSPKELKDDCKDYETSCIITTAVMGALTALGTVFFFIPADPFTKVVLAIIGAVITVGCGITTTIYGFRISSMSEAVSHIQQDIDEIDNNKTEIAKDLRALEFEKCNRITYLDKCEDVTRDCNGTVINRTLHDFKPVGDEYWTIDGNSSIFRDITDRNLLQSRFPDIYNDENPPAMSEAKKLVKVTIKDDLSDGEKESVKGSLINAMDKNYTVELNKIIQKEIKGGLSDKLNALVDPLSYDKPFPHHHWYYFGIDYIVNPLYEHVIYPITNFGYQVACIIPAIDPDSKAFKKCAEKLTQTKTTILNDTNSINQTINSL